MTELLRQRLIDHEGLRTLVYDDATGLPIKPGSVVKGHPTIGVGRALDVNGVSKAEALRMLDADIARATRQAESFDWFAGLNAPRREVIVELLFNLGLANFRKFNRTIAAIEAGDWKAAAEELLISKWRTQVGTRALTLAEMMRYGRYPKES